MDEKKELSEWVTFTRRTDDPKLRWLECQLSLAGIEHRRNGASFHAPILEVKREAVDRAWKILGPVDDVPDDDSQWETLRPTNMSEEDPLYAVITICRNGVVLGRVDELGTVSRMVPLGELREEFARLRGRPMPPELEARHILSTEDLTGAEVPFDIHFRGKKIARGCRMRTCRASSRFGAGPLACLFERARIVALEVNFQGIEEEKCKTEKIS